MFDRSEINSSRVPSETIVQVVEGFKVSRVGKEKPPPPPALPPPSSRRWTRVVSRTTGRVYWYDPLTGTSCW